LAVKPGGKCRNHEA